MLYFGKDFVDDDDDDDGHIYYRYLRCENCWDDTLLCKDFTSNNITTNDGFNI